MSVRKFIDYNRRLSLYLDSWLPEKFRKSGGAEFQKAFVPKYLGQGMLIYDVGGGKRPYLDVEKKNSIDATIVGIDISREELDAAPVGAYDKKVASAIEHIQGNQDGDLVICNAVLEHVEDVQGALESIYTLLKPGGIALLFVPSRNAAFARLNMLLPENVKKKLLFTLFPGKAYSGGFPAYYNNCTPEGFAKITNEIGFTKEEGRYYYWSSYFSFFVPLYLIWRLGFFVYYFFARTEACEGFVLALKK